MNKTLTAIKEKNQQKKIYARILTNRMTIVAHKLFKHDRQLHLALIIYRLRRDFGFTGWEIANFTGIPTRQVYKLYAKLKPILESEILKNLVKMDYDKEIEAWNNTKAPNGRQGYVSEKKKQPTWYNETKRYKRWTTQPDITIGQESEDEWMQKIQRFLAYSANT